MFEPKGPRTFEPLRSQRLILRRLADRDILPFLEYRNDRELRQFEGRDSMTLNEAQEFIDGQKDRPVNLPGEWLQIAIERVEDAQLIGDLGFYIDRDYPYQAEIGYRLARGNQGHGFATEAVACLLDYAFGSLGLHRVIAYVDCENVRSIAVLERLRFRREGHLLQSFLNGVRWTDDYLYAMLQSEWMAHSCKRLKICQNV